MSNIDYKRLGEVSGKAWRLGHMGAKGSEMQRTITTSLTSMKVPQAEQSTFRRGFYKGVLAVDKERGRAEK